MLYQSLTAFAAFALSTLSMSVSAGACRLECREGPCELAEPGEKTVELRAGAVREHPRCDALTRAKGRVALRYFHRNRWFTPPSVPDEFRRAFAAFPADPCSLLSPECRQRRMDSMTAAVGGHGIDSVAARAGGEGNPCAIGLPCGRILPPDDAWRFRLASPATNGSWLVQPLRGAAPEGKASSLIGKVEHGIVSADGSWFAPGRQYAYRLLDSVGATVATGEFSVLARSMADRLPAIVAREVTAGSEEAIAWIDALASNNLEWDAYQRSLAADGGTR